MKYSEATITIILPATRICLQEEKHRGAGLDNVKASTNHNYGPFISSITNRTAISTQWNGSQAPQVCPGLVHLTHT